MTMARWNRPRAAGVASSVLTLPPPPDWPKIVTLRGIAAEALDVVPHPLQRGDHVERAGIARLGKFFAADVGQVQVAEDVEALVDGHDHDVVLRGQIGPVEPRRVGRSRS